MKIAFLFLFAFSVSAQSIDRFLPEKAVVNPDAVIKEYAHNKHVPKQQRAYILGKCHAFLSHEDTALVYFIEAKKDWEKSGDTAWAKDVALEAYRIISSQENYEKFGWAFLEEYVAYANRTQSPVRLANSYMEYAKNAADSPDAGAFQQADAFYQKALVFALKSGNRDIIGKIYANMGILLTDYGRYHEARFSLEKSFPYVLESRDGFRLFAHYFNYGNSYLQERQYPKALTYFEKARQIALPYYCDKSLRKLYRKMADAADSIGDHSARRRYEDFFRRIDRQIKDHDQNIAIHAIDVKNEVKAKDQQISMLRALKTKFEQNRLVFSILLFLVFLLALYSFVRWKSSDRHKRKVEADMKEIETEHIRTVEQLEKVKQLVMEDHIVLKNKTKLYLDKLLYIRAEDHYLHFVPAEGKSSFLRGKLTDLTDQLPPNFRKCHRSYVVNTNCIKSAGSRGILLVNNETIPVSRDFKL